MPKPSNLLQRPAVRLSGRVLSVFVAVILFGLMLLTCVDVIGRYLFNAPVQGASELIQFGMGLVVFGALPLVGASGSHIVVGLLELVAGRAVQLLQRLVMTVTSVIALAVMGWRLYLTGVDLASYGDSSSFLRIPLAPMAYFMAAMALVAALAAVAHFFERPLQGEPESAE
ncbi:TRAP transporter small permease [Algihabitans albus]|uniref:TRAP transporter small permease n=1 Tax=Algihabitans albus TaxID=2164067 RepID=UPI0013C33AAF|nr:TRAP transporter small permease [Algihabitans albus]